MAITQIPSEFISTNAISGTIIADNAITAVHIATNAVSGTLIADNAVTAVHIATNAVSGTLIADNAITAVHIAGNSVTAALLEDNAVGTDQLAGIARGKIIYGDSSGAPQLLALGSNGQVLKSDGSDITWGSISTPITALNNATENELVTVGATTTELEAESGLTWDTSTLKFLNLGTSSLTRLLTFTSASSIRRFHIDGTETSGNTIDVNFVKDINGTESSLLYLKDGKVGIGTTSPSVSLHVQGTGEVNPIMVQSSGNCGISLDTTQTNGDEFAIRSVVNGTQPMLQFQNVDRSVNMININNGSKVHMGIGVVPEADWATDCDVIQLGGLGAWFSKSAQSASSATTLAQNVYDDTSVGQAYIVTDEASSIVLDDGTINFQYASSGSADAAISWNSAIYIDNNGNIGFGTGNPDPWYGMTNRILDVRGGSDNNYGGGIRFSSLNGSWYSTSIRNVQNAMVFASTFDDTVRLTIDATGKVTWPNTASSTTGAGNIAHSSNNWFYVRGGTEGAFLGGSGFTGNIKVAEGANQHEWEVNSADAMTINGSTRVLSGDFNDTSDAALKENITNITGGLSIIKQLQPRNFDWKEAGKVDGAAGFIAQEVATVLPNEVQGTDYSAGTRDEHGVKTGNSIGKTIKLAGILAHAVKAIQELEARVKTLEG